MYQIWISKVWKIAKILKNLYFISFKVKAILNNHFNTCLIINIQKFDNRGFSYLKLILLWAKISVTRNIYKFAFVGGFF